MQFEPEQPVISQTKEAAKETVEEKVIVEVQAPTITYGDESISSTPNPSTQTPFEILAHPVAELSGDWTPEKWEFWLREHASKGELSGGVLSLGQHGMIRGAIGGEIEFMIAREHHVLVSQMLDGLLTALKSDWPQTQLQIIHSTPTEITPVQRKEKRLKQAQIKAHELLVTDPAIEPLMTLFEGEVVELVMKEA